MKFILGSVALVFWNRWIFSLIWVACVLFGLKKLTTYAQTPSELKVAAAAWPADSLFKREGGKPSLVVFMHPKCSCSRATLGEVEKLLPKLSGHAQIILSFIIPKDAPGAWAESDLVLQARSWPGVQIHFDTDGLQSSIFNAGISGEAFFYDRAGLLQYHGGLTAARGHMGDNIGSFAVESWFASENSLSDVALAPFIKKMGAALNKEAHSFLSGQVFGCDLKRIASVGSISAQ